MGGMHVHFHKAIPLIPKTVYLELSKSGIGISFHFGPISKSFGPTRNTLSIDGPGHFGLGFRKVDGKHHDGTKTHHPTFSFSVFAIIVSGGLLYARLYYHLLNHCTISGSPAITLAVLIAASIAVYALVWHLVKPLQGPLFFLLAAALVYIDWTWLYHMFIVSSIHCAK